MTLYMCLIDILVQIDHKGPNWTFLKMTFRVIPHLSYFRLVSHQRRYMMQLVWTALSYYWIMSIIKGKWAKPDLSDLGNDLSNNSIKSISWQLINIIPRKLYTTNTKKLSYCVWQNWKKVAKQTFSDLEQWPLELFNESILWQFISTIS